MNEKDLRKFIEFTKVLLLELHEKKEYDWFFKSFKLQIVNYFFTNDINTTSIDKFQNITESDIIRIKTYLNFIDKKAISYGKIFYQGIIDDTLRKELIKDFKEMKIALKNENIIEFGRTLSLQIENIFNYSLRKLDIHNLIQKNKSYYQAIKSPWSGKPFDFYNSFFKFNKDTNQYEQLELSNVKFKIKSIFLSIEFNYKIDVKALEDIYFLRNKGSHRDQLTSSEKEDLTRIILDFDKNYSRYYKVLFDIVNGITNIKKEIH